MSLTSIDLLVLHQMILFRILRSYLILRKSPTFLEILTFVSRRRSISIVSMGKATPSSRNATVRKPETECGLRNGTESHELKKLESGNMNISGCEFKKGGRCTVYNT